MKSNRILVLDDDEFIIDLIEDILDNDHSITKETDGARALEIVRQGHIDLILADINMPGMNGLDFVRMARQADPDLACIIISGDRDIDNAIDALHSEVFDFIPKPFREPEMVTRAVNSALEKRQLLMENKRYKENLEIMVRERTMALEHTTRELLNSRNRIIGILSTAAEYKDYETGKHFIRVSKYTGIISRGLGLDEQKAKLIEQAAPVHDIGKIGIPESILMKEGKLTDDEYEKMQKHCLIGDEILKNRSLEDLIFPTPAETFSNKAKTEDLLNIAAHIALHHHERYNGSGYPLGLSGEAIPLEARIVAVADVYDALGSHRPYKKAWSEKECQDYMISQSGSHFDPRVIQAFLDNREEIIRIKAEYSDIGLCCLAV